LARSWRDAEAHDAELDAELFQAPAAEGLASWLEEWALHATNACS